MPTPLLILQIVTLLAVIFLLLRKQAAPEQDPRLAQIPDQLTRLDARNQALDEHIRSSFAQMRTDIATEAQRTREASAADFAALRTEITRNIADLSQILQTGLNGFRTDNKASDDLLRNAVQHQMDAITQRLSAFTNETNEKQTSLRESLPASASPSTPSSTT